MKVTDEAEGSETQSPGSREFSLRGGAMPFISDKRHRWVTSNSRGKPALKVGHCVVIPMDTRFSKKSESRSVVSDSLRPYGLYNPKNSPGHNTGAVSRSLLQGIFPTQGSNPGLPHCRRILYQLIYWGSPLF